MQWYLLNRFISRAISIARGAISLFSAIDLIWWLKPLTSHQLTLAIRVLTFHFILASPFSKTLSPLFFSPTSTGVSLASTTLSTSITAASIPNSDPSAKSKPKHQLTIWSQTPTPRRALFRPRSESKVGGLERIGCKEVDEALNSRHSH